MTTNKTPKKNSTRERINKSAKMGRPSIKINFEKIEKEVNVHQVIYWIGMQATAQEIAGSFRISPDSLDLKLKEVFGMTFTELKRFLGDGADGRLALRRNQFRLSEHNASMGIWLGKQWLSQKDVVQNDMNIMDKSRVSIYIPDNKREENKHIELTDET